MRRYFISRATAPNERRHGAKRQNDPTLKDAWGAAQAEAARANQNALLDTAVAHMSPKTFTTEYPA
jgi:hypothetical protein